MRTINIGDIGRELAGLLNEEFPVDEDIGILDEQGNVLGVVIPNDAYEFFLKKVEEEEDRVDKETVKEFHQSGERDQ